MNINEQKQFKILAANLDRVRDTGIEALKKQGIELAENSSIEDVVAEIENCSGNGNFSYGDNIFNFESYKKGITGASTPAFRGTYQWLANGFILQATGNDCYTNDYTSTIQVKGVAKQQMYEFSYDYVGARGVEYIFVGSDRGTWNTSHKDYAPELGNTPDDKSNVTVEGYGIAVESDGNYTDENGQQWICDELIILDDTNGYVIRHTKNFTVDGVNKLGNYMSHWTDTGITQWNTGIDSELYVKEVGVNHSLGNVICSHLPQSGVLYDETEHCRVNYDTNSKTIYIRCYSKWGVTTNKEINAILQSSPVTFVAQIATPKIVALTEEQVKPLFEKYGSFKAFFKSSQATTPSFENPVDIVTKADIYKVDKPKQKNKILFWTGHSDYSYIIPRFGVYLKGESVAISNIQIRPVTIDEY